MGPVKFLRTAVITAAFGLSTVVAHAVTIDVFTNLAAWQASIGSYVVEDFADSTLQAPLVSITGLGDGPSVNGIEPGKLWDRIDQDLSQDTTFTFSTGIFGVGGNFDLAGPGGPGSEIIIRTTAGLFSIGLIPNTTAGTFWGFTIDQPLLDVYFIEGPGFGGGAVETYTLDNMVIATSPIPEPGTLMLLGSGLLMAGRHLARRKRGGEGTEN